MGFKHFSMTTKCWLTFKRRLDKSSGTTDANATSRVHQPSNDALTVFDLSFTPTAGRKRRLRPSGWRRERDSPVPTTTGRPPGGRTGATPREAPERLVLGGRVLHGLVQTSPDRTGPNHGPVVFSFCIL